MKKVYGEIYNEDAFQGISVPTELRHVLVHLMNNESDTIIGIFDSYESYKEEEVEMSHYAKDGSDGTEEIETVQEFQTWFRREFESEIDSGRISETTLNLIKNLKEIPKSEILSDEEAIRILDTAIDTLIEIRKQTTDKKIHEVTDKLLYFRNNWLELVL